MAAHCVAGQGRRVGENQQLELIDPVRREKRLVHDLERHARLDERVVHAEHVIAGAVSRGGAGMERRGLLGVQQRHARERHLVAQVALVAGVPLVNAFDRGQPAAIVEHAGELRHPRPLAVRRPFRDPELDFRLALHGVLPAIRLLEADAEDPANRPPAHDRAELLRAVAVRPRRRGAAARLMV